MILPTNHGSMSDWLFVSDIDGTLNSKLRRTPKVNLEAIRHFDANLGGNFTLASGRSIKALEKYYKSLPARRVPCIILNGAGIYDFEKDEMLYFKPLNDSEMSTVAEAQKLFPKVGIVVYTNLTLYIAGVRAFSDFLLLSGNPYYKHYSSVEDMPKKNWGKVVFNGLPGDMKKLQRLFEAKGFDYLYSSPVSIELVGKGVNKGSALLELAKILGIDRTHTAAIGDYFNDEAMLKEAGVSACCGQAPEALREQVDYISCHCNYGSVADFLSYIERKNSAC